MELPNLTFEQAALIVGFVLPGAISMYVYGLKIPQHEFELKNRIPEAICYSLLNFMIVGIPVQYVLTIPIAQSWFVVKWAAFVLGFVGAPVVWPILLVRILQFAEARDWIMVRSRTAWDEFFGRRRKGCWIQVELNDGRVIGGRFSTRSYARAWPEPGHLYLEELWNVDVFGNFQSRVVGAPGALLRPGDYRLLRVY